MTTEGVHTQCTNSAIRTHPTSKCRVTGALATISALRCISISFFFLWETTQSGNITPAISRVPGVQNRDKIGSTFLAPAISGAHMWAEWLHTEVATHCVIAGLNPHR